MCEIPVESLVLNLARWARLQVESAGVNVNSIS